METKDFDYAALYDFLKVNRTSGEIKKRFNLAGTNELKTIITNATFQMPVYEICNGKHSYIYGLMENR